MSSFDAMASFFFVIFLKKPRFEMLMSLEMLFCPSSPKLTFKLSRGPFGPLRFGYITCWFVCVLTFLICQSHQITCLPSKVSDLASKFIQIVKMIKLMHSKLNKTLTIITTRDFVQWPHYLKEVCQVNALILVGNFLNSSQLAHLTKLQKNKNKMKQVFFDDLL